MSRGGVLTICSMLFMASAAQAAVIYDRGLPTTNLNEAAGANRSNVAWGDFPANDGTYNWMYGDSFMIGSLGQSFQITGLTVWIVGDNVPSPLSSIFTSLNLYGGIAGTTLSASPTCADTSGPAPCLTADGIGLIGSGSTSGDPNLTVNNLGALYQSLDQTYHGVFEVTFGNLNWQVDGGTTYEFFVNGMPGAVSNGGASPRLYAANGALSGNPTSTYDGLLWEGVQNASTSNFDAMDQWDSNGNGWNKSSDINVRIDGIQAPEPGTIGMFGGGLALLAFLRRKKTA